MNTASVNVYIEVGKTKRLDIIVSSFSLTFFLTCFLLLSLDLPQFLEQVCDCEMPRRREAVAVRHVLATEISQGLKLYEKFGSKCLMVLVATVWGPMALWPL